MTNNKVGRPPISKTEPGVKTSVTLLPSQIQWLKDYGNGNVSQGVRRLVNEKWKVNKKDV